MGKNTLSFQKSSCYSKFIHYTSVYFVTFFFSKIDFIFFLQSFYLTNFDNSKMILYFMIERPEPTALTKRSACSQRKPDQGLHHLPLHIFIITKHNHMVLSVSLCLNFMLVTATFSGVRKLWNFSTHLLPLAKVMKQQLHFIQNCF